MKSQTNHSFGIDAPRGLVLLSFLSCSVMLLFPVRQSYSQEGAFVREAEEELVRIFGRQLGRDATGELAKIGGEAAVRETVDKAAIEGGEPLVKEVVRHGTEYGPDAVRAIGKSPKTFVEALDGLPPDLVGPAIRAAAREPEAVSRVVVAFGRDGLQVVAQHPGVGTRLVEQLGSDGVSLGRSLSTDEVIVMTRNAGDINRLAPGQKAQVLAKIANSPAAVLDYLEAHPRVLLTGAGVAAVLALREDAMGAPSPDGSGLIDRTRDRLLPFLSPTIRRAGGVVVAGLTLWAAIKLWGTWRLARIRHAAVMAASARHQKTFPLKGDIGPALTGKQDT